MSREEAGARLRRVLAMVPWIAGQANGAGVEDLVARFGGDRKRVSKDLELLAGVDAGGEHGVRMWTDDGRWFVDPYGELGDSFRLTAPEAFALVAAARALLDVPGTDEHGALATALEKLGRVLHDVTGLEVDLDEPEFLAAVREATEAGQRLEIEYYTASRDQLTQRRVDPLAIFAVGAQWHAIAFDHLTGEERDFRVDRIRALAVTGEAFGPRAPTRLRAGVAFQPGDGTEAVVLDLGPEHDWVAESYPVRDVQTGADGRTRLTVDVGGTAWLEALLLRLGPTARVVDPPELRTAGAEVARRLLGAYRA